MARNGNEAMNTEEPARRPWYTFRWRILFWIALPFVWIAVVDSVAMLIAIYRSR